MLGNLFLYYLIIFSFFPPFAFMTAPQLSLLCPSSLLFKRVNLQPSAWDWVDRDTSCSGKAIWDSTCCKWNISTNLTVSTTYAFLKQCVPLSPLSLRLRSMNWLISWLLASLSFYKYRPKFLREIESICFPVSNILASSFSTSLILFSCGLCLSDTFIIV